jgi:hypothetical protein
MPLSELVVEVVEYILLCLMLENILELVVWGPDVLFIVGMRKVDLRAEIGFHAFLL